MLLLQILSIPLWLIPIPPYSPSNCISLNERYIDYGCTDSAYDHCVRPCKWIGHHPTNAPQSEGLPKICEHCVNIMIPTDA